MLDLDERRLARGEQMAPEQQHCAYSNEYQSENSDAMFHGSSKD
jgi:hypothetical protein